MSYRKSFVLIILFISLLISNSIFSKFLSADDKVGKKDIKVQRQGFTSSAVCQNCHSEIFKSWSNSMHANSVSDPIFDASYLQAIKSKGEDARKFCLSCH